MHTEAAQPATPTLPSLGDGVHLLELDQATAGPLHALAVDHVLSTSARPSTPAYWVDAGRTAQTYELSTLAPSPRVLERFQVARGFTPHQHHDIVREAARQANSDTPLVVAPRMDQQYRDADCPAGVAEDLLTGAVDRLDDVAQRYGTPVLVTVVDSSDVAAEDSYVAPLRDIADRILSVEQTALGPRFVGDGVETLVYPVESTPAGDLYQTTLTYWQRIIEKRVRQETTPKSTSTGSTATARSEESAGGL
jgi:hypothetical protein